MEQILVISDTHVRTVQELPKGILQAIREVEWVVHCGDYASVVVVDELRHLARHFLGVYGNTDPSDIRQPHLIQAIDNRPLDEVVIPRKVVPAVGGLYPLMLGPAEQVTLIHYPEHLLVIHLPPFVS